MRLTELVLHNVRLYGADGLSLKFDPDKHATVLLGDNGCGKTTVLQAISTILGSYLSQFPGSGDVQMTDDDVHIGDNGVRGDYLGIEAKLAGNGIDAIDVKRYRRGRVAAPAPQLKEIKSYAQHLISEIDAKTEDVKLPIIAYYGTERGRITAPERRRNFKKAFGRGDGYVSAMTPATDFKSFFQWFDFKEDEERREREARWDRDYTDPSLNAVRHALEKFVGEDFTSPAIKLHPLRFVMNQKNTGRSLRIEQLSDGYRIVISMIADIASRMAELNPSDRYEDILSTPGIILIDEIDLHLHPKWQRCIVSQLIKTFPNVQFVLTTHSPLVVLDASENAEVVNLANIDGTPSDLRNYDVGLTLISSLFGIEGVQAPMWDDMIARRRILLGKPELSDQDRAELANIDSALADLSMGRTSEEIESDRIIRRLADKLGIG